MSDLWNIRTFIEQECLVDRTYDDVTTRFVLAGENPACRAVIRPRENGVFCGDAVCSAVREIFEGKLSFHRLMSDGQEFAVSDELLVMEGPASECLSLERTLVNFLSHLCGVATLTRKFVKAIFPYPSKILATRKTLPGLRELELLAVKAGGGYVHRRSLSDGILIKDNHTAFVDEATAITRAKQMHSPLHRVEIEVQDLASLDRVLATPPDVIMLDNMPIRQMQAAIKKIDQRCQIEVSGGVTLENVRSIAELGVHYISVGQLTHSPHSLNLTMDLTKVDSCREK